MRLIKKENKSIASDNFEKLRMFSNEKLEETIESIESTWNSSSVTLKVVDHKWKTEFNNNSPIIDSYKSFKTSIIDGSKFLSDQETEKLVKNLFGINNPDLNKIRKNFMSENDGPDEFISSNRMLSVAFGSLFNNQYKSVNSFSKDIIQAFSFCFQTIGEAKTANSNFTKNLFARGIETEQLDFSFNAKKDYDELYSLEEDLNELLFNLIPLEIQNKFTIEIDLFFSRVNKNITLSKMDKEDRNSLNFIRQQYDFDLKRNPVVGTVVFDINTIKSLAKLTSEEFDIRFKELIQKAILDGYKVLYYNIDKKLLSENYDLELYWMFAKEETIKTILLERFKSQNKGFFKDELQIMMSLLN